MKMRFIPKMIFKNYKFKENIRVGVKYPTRIHSSVRTDRLIAISHKPCKLGIKSKTKVLELNLNHFLEISSIDCSKNILEYY